MAPFGVIFDADGVLLDSERQSLVALRLAVESVTAGKVSLPPDRFAFFCGRDDSSILELLAAEHGLAVDPGEFLACKIECYRQAIAADPIAVAPGALELLDRLDTAGIPYGIATAASRAKINLSLAAVGLSDRFSITTTADEIHAGKPEPEVFQLTAGRLDLPPGQLVVFEDSINGVEAANRAGMVSVAVIGSFSREQLSHACHVIDNLSQVTVALLRRWVEEQRGSCGDRGGP